MGKIIDLRSITPRTNGTRKVSDIEKIVRHHSATKTGDFHSFMKHWKNVNGWGTGGYAEIILRNGDVQICYDPEEITNGVGGENSYTYHICLVGNGEFTKEQEKAFEERALFNRKRFGLLVSDIVGHKEFKSASTACPGIDMKVVRKRLSLLEQNVSRETSKKGENPYVNYVVKSGDSLSTICHTNDIKVLQNVGKINGLRSINMIRVGQVLKIPVELVE